MNGQLVLVEWQCYMSLGLCLRYGQADHLARSYSKQSTRLSIIPSSHVIQINPTSILHKLAKNKLVVPSSPRELIT